MRTATAVLLATLVWGCEESKDPANQAAAAAEAESKSGVTEATKAAADKVKPAKDKMAAAKADWESIPELTIEQTEGAIKAGAIIVDANGAGVREKFGVIPGAVKLANYREYEPSAVLPKDKAQQVVFYCGNTKCTAAPKAAAKAKAAGYTNVSHMTVGIKGWVEAGKKVEKG